jgi:hypothetical protein
MVRTRLACSTSTLTPDSCVVIPRCIVNCVDRLVRRLFGKSFSRVQLTDRRSLQFLPRLSTGCPRTIRKRFRRHHTRAAIWSRSCIARHCLTSYWPTHSSEGPASISNCMQGPRLLLCAPCVWTSSTSHLPNSRVANPVAPFKQLTFPMSPLFIEGWRTHLRSIVAIMLVLRARNNARRTTRSKPSWCGPS